MTKRVFILYADGTATFTDSLKNPTYETLSKAVGGMIETIPYFTKLEYDGITYNRGTAYCNEEGLLLGLPFNANATEAWKKSCPKGNVSLMHLCGDVIFYATNPQTEKTT